MAKWIILLSVATVMFTAGADEKPRLALLPCGDQMAGAIVALMETDLSKKDDVILLERANVGKILAEQGIAQDGGVNADNALTASRLLKCSIFSELYYEQGKQGVPSVCSLVAFDSITGVRLCDSTLDVSQGAEKLAEEGGKLLAMAIRKLPGEGARPAVRGVTLCSVRNVDLPVEHSGLSACLGGMIERQLLRAPGITVLERKRVDQVNKESALTGDVRDRLLASTVLLDLDLYRGKKAGTLRIRCAIRTVAGKELGSVELEGDISDVQSIVAEAARLILGVLDLPAGPTTADVNRRESDRFSAEFRRYTVRQRFHEALVAAETVVALDPQNLSKQSSLCRALEAVAWIAVAEKRYIDVLDIVERDMEIRETWIKSNYCPKFEAGPWFCDLLRFVFLNRDKINADDQVRLLPLRQASIRWFRYECAKRSKWYQIRCLDLCSQSADEWLDELLRPGLSWSDTYQYLQKDKSLLYGIGDLSDKGAARVMDYYKAQVDKGNAASGQRSMDAAIGRVMFPRFFPKSFSNADELVRCNLRELVDLVISHGKDSGPLFYFTIRYSSLQLSPDILIPELKRLLVAADNNKIVVPQLALDLAVLERDLSRDPGAPMVDACRRLLTPGYTLCTNAYGSARNCQPQTPEGEVSRLKMQYLSIFKKPMDLDTDALTACDKQGKVPSWKTAEKVFSVSKQQTTITSLELAADDCYLVLKRAGVRGQKDSAGYSLMKIGLDDGKANTIHEINTDKMFYGKIQVGKKAVYLPGADGFIIMPLDGRAPIVFERGRDLVDAQVDSIIEVENKVYFGCSRPQRAGNDTSYSMVIIEGHLMCCDLNGKNINVLASSARSQKASPLDNTDPYQIKGFFLDEPRNRILFIADAQYGAKSGGAYAFNLQEGKISKVFDPFGSWMHGPRAWGEGNCLVGSGHGSVLKWDCARDKLVTFICDWSCAREELVTFKYNQSRCDKRPAFHQGDACIETVAVINDVLYTAAAHNNRLPAVLKWATRDINCEKATPLPPLDKTTPILLRKWHGNLVACTENEVWILVPANEKASSTSMRDAH